MGQPFFILINSFYFPIKLQCEYKPEKLYGKKYGKCNLA